MHSSRDLPLSFHPTYNVSVFHFSQQKFSEFYFEQHINLQLCLDSIHTDSNHHRIAQIPYRTDLSNAAALRRSMNEIMINDPSGRLSLLQKKTYYVTKRGFRCVTIKAANIAPTQSKLKASKEPIEEAKD